MIEAIREMKKGETMNDVQRAIRLQFAADRKRLNAPHYDEIRADCDLREASALENQARGMLMPREALQKGAGGEIVPPASLGAPGLENALQSPDNLALEATVQRADLADAAGVFELALQAAESTKAKTATEQMLSHQLAAAHKHMMRLLADSKKEKDQSERCRLISTAARLMDAFSRGASTLQRLQTGASQVVQVQHVQVNGQAIIGNPRGGHA